MDFIVEYVVAPKYADLEHTTIDMTVKFAHLNEPIPFSASLNDLETHGVDLYNRAIALEFGPIVEFEPPVISPSDLASIARQKRNELLKQSDWTQLNDIPEDTQLLWQPYRQELRDISKQPGFPTEIEWPTPPVI